MSRWALVALAVTARPTVAGERLAASAHMLDGDTIIVDCIHINLRRQ